MNRIIIILFLAVTLMQVKAQQDPMFTHYMYNTLSVNPAYAGSREALTATLLHRTQWMQFPGSPKTQSITVHSPVTAGVNLGLAALHDQIGPLKFNSYTGSYAYRFNLTPKRQLALGLSTGVHMYNVNYGDIALIDADDPAFNAMNQKTTMNIGFGAYYSTERFYAGVSTPAIVEKQFSRNLSFDNNELNYTQRHYYLIAGSMIRINSDWDFKPTGLMKVTRSTPMQLDVTGQMVYQNKFDFGVMLRTDLDVTKALRTGDGIGVLVGVDLMENVYLGYSYDYSFANPTRYANLGSHEVMLRYDLIIKDKHRIRSPRYF